MENQPANPWRILSSEEKYENNWIQVTEYQVMNPSGNNGIYGVVHFKNMAIGIIALDADYNIYLVGQYRVPLDAYSWEIPEGGGPLGIDPLESARRELMEETGLEARQWRKVLQMHLSNSVSDEFSIIYLARDFIQHDPNPEETEQLDIVKLPFDEAYKKVQQGLITDSISVAAILQLKLMMIEGDI
jgi:8-oxo-dGTP pyrophosphatase MutT (NUDIX family)